MWAPTPTPSRRPSPFPLEEAINGVEGMRYISSSSTNSGTSSITATFKTGYDLDIAAVDVQNRVASVQGRLPAAVNATGITITKSNSNFVFGAGFFTRDGRYSPEFISNYLDVYVKDALKRVPGVGDVMIFGERKYAMRVWLDPVRLAARGLTATDVVNALVEQNVEIPAGQLGQPPSDSEAGLPGSGARRGPAHQSRRVRQHHRQELLQRPGAAQGCGPLRGGRGGLQLGAQIHRARGHGHRRHAALQRQRPRCGPPGQGRACRSSPRAFRRAWNTPSPSTPPPWSATPSAKCWSRSAMAIFIVIAVIFLFLLDWRATIIPAVTIPVSLIGTFAFIKIFGFSINSLTLFGITLATGLVVDDAIVVIENVQRHIAMEHSDPHEATSRAMGEVTSAVIATSLVLDRGLRAGFVLSRHHRHSLSPVLADHRLCHRHLGLQRAHAFAGAVGHVPARRRRPPQAAGLPAHRAGLARSLPPSFTPPTRRSAGWPAPTPSRFTLRCSCATCCCCSSSPAWAQRFGSTSTFPPASFPRKTRAS